MRNESPENTSLLALKHSVAKINFLSQFLKTKYNNGIMWPYISAQHGKLQYLISLQMTSKFNWLSNGVLLGMSYWRAIWSMDIGIRQQ